MTIYDRLVNHVTDGGQYKVDLVEKNLRLGKELVVNEGKFEGELIGDLSVNPWEMLERLYDNFYHSRPSAWADKNGKYFKAKPGEDMDFVELAQGEPRHIAKAKLEGYVLCAVLAGLLRWNPLYGNWFWRSPQHEDLRLLKVWF